MTASVDYQHAPPPEPFGQTGVLQYFGRLAVWCFITIGLAAAAMSHRSGSYTDAFRWNGRGQILRVDSSSGQLSVVAAFTARNLDNDQGWGYRGNYGRRRWSSLENWDTAIGQTLGIEASLNPPFRDVSNGVWVHIKWQTIAVLFLIQPVVYFVRRLFTRRR